jgi:serine/threonine-protein kinase
VKVADFGIAHIEIVDDDAGRQRDRHAELHVARADPGLPIDGRSDLFSAGVILYQFLTGERPFTGSSTATMHKVLEEDPLPPSRFNVQVPGAMDAVVRKALAKRPDERYQSAEEFADALRAAAQREADRRGRRHGYRVGDPTVIRAPEPKGADDNACRGDDAGGTPAVTRPLPHAARRRSGERIRTGAPAKKSQATAIAIVAVRRRGDRRGLWTMLKPVLAADSSKAADAAKSRRRRGAPPAKDGRRSPRRRRLPKTEAGTMVISATGFVDPTDPRYAPTKSQMAADLRADSKGQLVAKALGLMLDTARSRRTTTCCATA